MRWGFVALWASTVAFAAPRGLPSWLPSPRDQARIYADRDLRAPQHEDPKRVFEETSPKFDAKGGYRDGLMVCRAQASVEKRWDTFADPDLKVTIGLGTQKPITVFGPETSYVAYVTVPVTVLAVGEKVSLMLEDRDLATDEFVGSDTVAFDGTFPLNFESKYLEAKCRAVEPEKVRTARTNLLAAVDGALATMKQQVRPDFEAADLGQSSYATALTKVGYELNQAAPWLGWAHPDLAAKLTSAEAQLTEFHDALRAPIEKKWDSLTKADKVKIGSLELSIAQSKCSMGECSLVFEVLNTGAVATKLDKLGATAHVIFANGVARDLEPHFEKFNTPPQPPLKPSEKRAVVLDTRCGRDRECRAVEAPRFVRFGTGNNATYLKL